MGYLHLGEGHYVVSVDIRRLQDNPCFMQLTEHRESKLFSHSQFIGRGGDGDAYYLTNTTELGTLVRFLLIGVKDDVSVHVRQAQERNIPLHLKDNALSYFEMIKHSGSLSYSVEPK